MTSVPYWHVLALWKIAIIVEGVRRRVRDGTSEGRLPPDGLVEALLSRATACAEAAGL